MTILTYVWQNIWVNLTKILSQNLDKGSQLWVYFIAEPLWNIWSWCRVLRGVASVGLLVPLGDGVNGLGAEALPQRSVLVLRQGRWCRRGEGGWELARRVRGGLEGGALGAGVVIGLLLVHGDTRPHTREESHLLPGRMNKHDNCLNLKSLSSNFTIQYIYTDTHLNDWTSSWPFKLLLFRSL